ncbi:hypothetical protein [Acanthopleuribacter pedis]|uniref:Uncharacterized protein n=1 Tax=Acanthopleuribacter pedis TaxID=442870 RepID=A0A8J7U5P6_9BACT|nr:hypothetical protein [Acanthopleuribacter pedis]MBO1321074.1 hypothetical protein [Acanthopleuribacter pedis]
MIVKLPGTQPLVLLMLSLLAACAPKSPTRIAVTLADDLNDDRALPVQIAVFHARDVPNSLGPREARRWFARQGRALLAKDAGFLHAWEWVPGQELPHGVSLHGVRRPVYLIFADYRREGTQAVVLRDMRHFRLSFEKRRFLVRAVADGSSLSKALPPLPAVAEKVPGRFPQNHLLPENRSTTPTPAVISSQRSPLRRR